jgi:hypothetical protein
MAASDWPFLAATRSRASRNCTDQLNSTFETMNESVIYRRPMVRPPPGLAHPRTAVANGHNAAHCLQGVHTG